MVDNNRNATQGVLDTGNQVLGALTEEQLRLGRRTEQQAGASLRATEGFLGGLDSQIFIDNMLVGASQFFGRIIEFLTGGTSSWGFLEFADKITSQHRLIPDEFDVTNPNAAADGNSHNIQQQFVQFTTDFANDPAGTTQRITNNSVNELFNDFVNESPLSITFGEDEVFRVPSLSEMSTGIHNFFVPPAESSEGTPEALEEGISTEVQTPSTDLVSSVSHAPTQDVAANLIRSTFSNATGPAGGTTEMASVMADAQNMFDMGGIATGATQVAGLSNDGPFTVAALHSSETPEWVRQGGANFNNKLELAV